MRDIPLQRGENRITAAFIGPGGEGPLSEPVTVTLDNVPPSIELSAPQNHAVINAESVDVQGVTEAGAKVTIRNISHTGRRRWPRAPMARSTRWSTWPQGRTRSRCPPRMRWEPGDHRTDRHPRSGSAQAQLVLSPKKFRLHHLPATMDVQLVVVDADGRAADGAKVTFSLSPPGEPTSTYEETTEAGHASWLGVSLPKEGAIAGDGFVTALVELADGSTVQESAPFTIH